MVYREVKHHNSILPDWQIPLALTRHNSWLGQIKLGSKTAGWSYWGEVKLASHSFAMGRYVIEATDLAGCSTRRLRFPIDSSSVNSFYWQYISLCIQIMHHKYQFEMVTQTAEESLIIHSCINYHPVISSPISREWCKNHSNKSSF